MAGDDRTHITVRRIDDKLFIGNRHAATRLPEGTFDAVLSVSSEPSPLTTHHHPLTDGPGNDWAAFAAAVDTARTLHRRDGTLLVNCSAGISRSATVLATALATERECPLRETLELVWEARPRAMPHPALHELAVVYLAART
ncbi:Dual specificity phosphatase, catalytic domain [Halogranum gelatinilyticum]|uniref:Dual specificity phosphatase, catalytic domain n=1 Tax=Halogranum gelatinilyticum TaxID=660521 RepID=A0A1G9TV06_9EURY|nr:dual specificity protein phosphatase [Halogranum gelatinilyticum]SDM51527.1 Dual specificity phosphatase, catalytic domain [Halogranum gelatinilyticum]